MKKHHNLFSKRSEHCIKHILVDNKLEETLTKLILYPCYFDKDMHTYIFPLLVVLIPLQQSQKEKKKTTELSK